MATPNTSAVDLIAHNGTLQEHWVKRLVAIIVDFILISVVGLILSLLLALFIVVGPFGFYSPYDFLPVRVGGFLLGLLALGYFTIFEGSGGRTPGKAIMGLKVVSILGPLGHGKAALRNLSKLHWILLLVDVFVGFVTAGDPRQRFLDRLAETTVTRTGQGALAEEQFRHPAYTHGAVPTGGVVYCSNCGTALVARADGRRGCPNCGTIA